MSSERVDLSCLRVPYSGEDTALSEPSLNDPFNLFHEWFGMAQSNENIKEANAMALATADKSGSPSVRYVLLKSYGRDGFRFFTNYESRKAREIAENSRVSLVFYWDVLCRQVRIEGQASKLSESESSEYFHLRPRPSQISASVSPQSTVIENREEFVKKRHEFDQQHADTEIPYPNHWGGYLVVPDTVEFWHGRTNRFHDRIRFRKQKEGEIINEKTTYRGEDGWVYEYLAP